MRWFTMVAVFALISCGDAVHPIPLHDVEVIVGRPPLAPKILSLTHAGENGAVMINTATLLEVKATDPAGEGLAYTWRASGGSLDPRGSTATWRTPARPGVYTVSIEVADATGAATRASVNIAVTSAIRAAIFYPGSGLETVVEDEHDEVGYACSIALDSTQSPHISYYDKRHQQTRHAWYGSSGWTVSIVDGPGFNTGVRAGLFSSVAVDQGSDVAHVAYEGADGTVHYARWDWDTTRWEDRALLGPGRRPSIGLNPARGTRPEVVYTEENSPTDVYRVHYALRDGGTDAGTDGVGWTRERPDEATGCWNWGSAITGRLAFAPDGTAHTTAYMGCYTGTYTQWTALEHLERAPGGGWTQDIIAGDKSFDYTSPWSFQYAYRAPQLARSAAGDLAIVTNAMRVWTGITMRPLDGLFFRGAGSGAWTRSDVEFSNDTPFLYSADVALTASGKPVLSLMHNNAELEVATPDAGGRWVYTYVGEAEESVSLDSTSYYFPSSIAVDNQGRPHVCYERLGALRYY